MKKVFAVVASIVTLGTMVISFGGCGTDYCSYGGCMNEAEPGSDRCSIHQGLENDPNYGVPDEWKVYD